MTIPTSATSTTPALFTYTNLIVWQKSIALVTTIYDITAQFPKEEQYGLTSQMRRAAVSIPSNIAEGKRRGTKKEYRQFLRIAFGSGAELETQIIIAKQLAQTKNLNFQKADLLLTEVMRMLCVMINTLRPSKKPNNGSNVG